MKVFISHSWMDRNLAAAVGDQLMTEGHVVVFPFSVQFEGSNVATELSTAIRTADAVVALVTTTRPNLLYEVGLAAGALRPLIIAARDVTQLPFDIASVPYVALTGQLDQDALAIANRVRKVRVPVLLPPPRFESAEAALRAISEDTEVAAVVGAAQFETLLFDLFRERGYNMAKSPQGRRDKGFDFSFYSTTGALVLVEAKKYSAMSRVSLESVHHLAGVVAASSGAHGLLITTSAYTTAAVHLAASASIALRSLKEVLNATSDDELLI